MGKAEQAAPSSQNTSKDIWGGEGGEEAVKTHSINRNAPGTLTHKLLTSLVKLRATFTGREESLR